VRLLIRVIDTMPSEVIVTNTVFSHSQLSQLLPGFYQPHRANQGESMEKYIVKKDEIESFEGTDKTELPDWSSVVAFWNS